MIPFFPDACLYFLPLIQTIAVITIIYASLSTLRQIDTKQLVAMSSVAQKYPNGPLNKSYLLSQTICGKPNGFNPFYLCINIISYYLNNKIPLKSSTILVLILNNYLGNSQITKTCLNIYHVLGTLILFFFALRLRIEAVTIKYFNMAVEISETTRLLFTNIIILFKFFPFFNFLFYNITGTLYTLNYSNFSYSNLIQTIFDSNYKITSTENKNKESHNHFYEWLAGLIDGDGYFWIRKINRLTSLVITFDIRDIQTAQMIKDRLGGNLNILSGNKAVRFKLHNYEAIVSLVNNINGLIRTPNRIEQLKLVCLNYGIEYKDPIKLEYNNAWFSGFFDSDGHVSYNKTGGRVNICITQKNEKLLLELARIYNGKVYNHSKSSNNYRFIISNKSSVLTILKDYFSKYPSRTMKQNRLLLIKKYYELRSIKCHLAQKGSSLHKAWVKFNKNWLNYNYY